MWLRDAGYRTGLFGKYLNAYDDETEGNKGPGGGFYVPPGWDRWWAFLSPEHYGGVHGQTYEVVEEDGSRSLYTDHSSDAQYSTDLSAERMRSFIGAAVADGQPFFAYWAPYASHAETPGLIPAPAARHWDAFAGLSPWRPPSWDEADVGDKPRWVRSALRGGAATDVMRQRAYETLLAVDEQLGLLLDHLTTLGVQRDTVIVVTSDHGVGWGEHRWFFQLKGCPYEECQRVPMLVRYPRRLNGSATRTEPVLNIDLAPTLAELAGVPLPVGVDGRSFRGLMFGAAPASWRGDYLMEWWRKWRGDSLYYTRQVADGDRLRLFHGDPLARPRAEVRFEFDVGDGVASGSIAVPIGASALESFRSLGILVRTNVPNTDFRLETGALTILDLSPTQRGVYWWEDADSGDAFAPAYGLADYFGVRDVANGYAWVEYETGERELYDLNVDPHQLENRADDPSYAGVRQQLEARLAVLRPPPACSDGLDNDADGRVDFPADPGCIAPDARFEDPACDNDRDDDGDGRIDWDGGPPGGAPDPHCLWAWRPTEAADVTKACGAGFELTGVLALLLWMHGRRRRPAGRDPFTAR